MLLCWPYDSNSFDIMLSKVIFLDSYICKNVCLSFLYLFTKVFPEYYLRVTFCINDPSFYLMFKGPPSVCSKAGVRRVVIFALTVISWPPAMVFSIPRLKVLGISTLGNGACSDQVVGFQRYISKSSVLLLWSILNLFILTGLPPPDWKSPLFPGAKQTPRMYLSFD